AGEIGAAAAAVTGAAAEEIGAAATEETDVRVQPARQGQTDMTRGAL
ncbi:MAG: hypothetical protein HUU31_22525, partial [Anaerolineae bacterium]|nr:hypothetical protein [Anaerolineae bacterium]